MKVEIERVSSTRKKMTVFLPPERVAEKREAAFRKVAGGVTVKGFRKGKIPRRVIESMYGKEVDQETASGLVSDTLKEALAENSIAPVETPDIERMDGIEKGRGFSYSVEFDVIPDFELSDYNSIPVKKTAFRATARDVDAAMEQLRENNADSKLTEDGRPAREGDIVLIDFRGEVEGGGEADGFGKENFGMILGDGNVFPEFTENLAGKNKGDAVEFSVSYPDDSANRAAAGKTVRFFVDLKEIRERILPEIDDDFAMGFDLDTVSELREALRKEMERRHEEQQASLMRGQIVDALLAENRFDVPPSLLEKEVANLKSRFAFDLAGTEIGPDTVESEDLRPKFAEKAAESVRTSIILAAVAEKENVRVDEKRVEEHLNRMAGSGPAAGDENLRRFYRDSGTMDRVRSQLRVRAVLDLLLERAAVAEAETEPGRIDNE